MADWQCVGENQAAAEDQLARAVADLREEIDRLAGERAALEAERKALQEERAAQRTEQLLRETARQERARMFDQSLREQAELLRELYQQDQQRRSSAVSVFTTTPPLDTATTSFSGRFPLIGERLRNLNWRRPATLDRVAL